MSEIAYYVIDLESTGLKCAYHEPSEISVIRATDKVQFFKNIKCKYPLRANLDALKITKKTLADLDNGEDLEDVVKKCHEFIISDGLTPAHRCIVGHNIITFDKKFLFWMWEQVGLVFPANLWLDTMQLTRDYAKKTGVVKPKVNLQAACTLVGIKKFATAHSSVMDSRNTYLLWKNLVEDKEIDYLPFIKTFQHSLSEPEQGLDPDLL